MVTFLFRRVKARLTERNTPLIPDSGTIWGTDWVWGGGVYWGREAEWVMGTAGEFWTPII